MDWTAIIVALLAGGGLANIILALGNKDDTKAGAYQKLSNVVITLTNELTEEIEARKKDRHTNNEEILRLGRENLAELANLQETYELRCKKLEDSYKKQLQDLEQTYKEKLFALEMRVGELERERDKLIIENHNLRTQLKGDSNE
jgi:hypothetical protein